LIGNFTDHEFEESRGDDPNDPEAVCFKVFQMANEEDHGYGMITQCGHSKEVDPLTGMQNSYIGWHFTMTEALDVLGAMIWLKTQTTWDYSICANPDNPSLIRLSLTGPIGNVQIDPANPTAGVMVQVIVDDTDYFVYEQGVFTAITAADAAANYDVEAYTLPTPPPPPDPPPPPPAMGVPEPTVNQSQIRRAKK
jgi:hypothetical protein